MPLAQQQTLCLNGNEAGPPLIPDHEAFYTTTHGAAYLGDSLDLLRALPQGSVNLVLTSPPYALHFKKSYGNVSKADYVAWYKPFAAEVFRVLRARLAQVLDPGLQFATSV